MKFLLPHFLWLLPVYLLLGAGLAIFVRKEIPRRLAAFFGSRASAGGWEGGVLRRKLMQLFLVVAAMLLLGLALARPLGGPNSAAAVRTGINLLVAIDGSESMLTEDAPKGASRFAYAQSGVVSLMGNSNGDRIGLMMFGGQATLVSPLTFDTVALRLIDQGLTPELVGKGGSSLATVIARAAAFFHSQPAYKNRVLILFTDGEETEGDAVVAAEEAYRVDGLRIFTVGVGTEQGGPIPLLRRNEQRDWVKLGTVHDQAGNEVRSRMNPRVLRNVAAVAGGTFTDLTEAKGDVRELYARNLLPLALPLEEPEAKDLTEWFQFPLVLALMLLVWEMTLVIRRRTARPVATATVTLLALGVALVGIPRVRADIAETQSLITGGKGEAAFQMLQQERLAKPNDPLVNYNYAIGAYATGRFDIARTTFEKLTTSYDLTVASQSEFQLGNSLYRLGESMYGSNPEGALALWLKASLALAKAPGPMSAHHLVKVHRDLFALIRELAQRKEREGDEAARVTPDQGIPAWREAAGYLDRGLNLGPSETEAMFLNDAKAALIDKIFAAKWQAAEDKSRQATLQHGSALENAIALITDAIGDYDEALTLKPGDPKAKEGRERALALLEPWQLELAQLDHATGEKTRAISLPDAIGYWQKAAGLYDEVLRKNPSNSKAISGRMANNRSLHDGHVELGDGNQRAADAPGVAPEERDALLEAALDHYQAALAIEPENVSTREKLGRLGSKLVGLFLARGQAELGSGRKLAATPKPVDAVPWLERSIQSFGQALRFDPVNAAAKTGHQEAENLLRKLRGDQNRVLAHNKTLQNPEQLKDTGKLALKLIDYDTDKLSSKKQQNYTLPENRPVKDW